MKILLEKIAIAVLAFIIPAVIATNVQAIPVDVDVELALVIDTSGSIDAAEFALQRNGYAAAFNSAGVQNAIQSLGDAGTGGVAVGVYFFNTNATVTVGWTQLQTAADSSNFAAVLAALADPTDGWTNIAAGMALGIDGILDNNFDGSRLVMDVSGDGKQNVNLAGVSSMECRASKRNHPDCYGLVDTQRDDAAANDIIVNGLAIIDDFADLATYYDDHVATSDGFVYDATFETFASAVEQKIYREITNDVPEPATLVLMGLGLIGIGAARRRKAA